MRRYTASIFLAYIKLIVVTWLYRTSTSLLKQLHSHHFGPDQLFKIDSVLRKCFSETLAKVLLHYTLVRLSNN